MIRVALSFCLAAGVVTIALPLLAGCQWSPTPFDTGRVLRGQVVDALSGEGLSDVAVEVDEDGPVGPVVVARTDAAGRFNVLLNSAQGPVAASVSFKRDGYTGVVHRHEGSSSRIALSLGFPERLPDPVRLEPAPR